MRRRRWLVWLVYAAVSVQAVAVLISGAKRVQDAERDADLRRASALALWRMDSVALALIAREAARPAWQYEPFGAPDTSPLASRRSPLLDQAAPLVLLHAWRDARDVWRSPSAPNGPERARAIAELGTDAPIAEWLIAEERLARWSDALDELEEQADDPAPTAPVGALADAPDRSAFAASVAAAQPERLSTRWASLPDLPSATLVFARTGPATRRVAVLDWTALEARLVGAAVDLLPNARVRPALDGDAYRLAALPISLEPGDVPTPDSGLVPAAAVLGLGTAIAVGVALGAFLREADRRARFAAAVTHELRTPLTALGLSLDLARTAEEPARVRELAERAHTQAERLRRTGEAVLAFAGAETDQAPAGPVAIGVLLESVWPALEAAAASVGIELERPAAVDPRAGVRLSAPRLERALSNLVENAGRHGAGPAEITVRVARGRLLVGVADRGPGVPASERRRVLRAFERGSRANPGGGVGLGLAIAADAVRAAGGRLRVRERSGGGAWFELDLPRWPVAES